MSLSEKDTLSTHFWDGSSLSSRIPPQAGKPSGDRNHFCGFARKRWSGCHGPWVPQSDCYRCLLLGPACLQGIGRNLWKMCSAVGGYLFLKRSRACSNIWSLGKRTRRSNLQAVSDSSLHVGEMPRFWLDNFPGAIWLFSHQWWASLWHQSHI